MNTLVRLIFCMALVLSGCAANGTGCPTHTSDSAGLPEVAVNVRAERTSIGCSTVRVEYTDPALLHPLQYTLSLWLSAGVETRFLLVQTAEVSPLSDCTISVTSGTLRPDYDGWASWKGDGSLGCQVEIDEGVIYNWRVLQDVRIYNTLAHELGHCLRLPHSADSQSFMESSGSGSLLLQNDARKL